jgi:hypothetical protein
VRNVMHRYLLCGWQTHSDIPLTGVPTSLLDHATPDVVIELATGDPPVLESTGRFVFQHATSRSYIRINDVADFEIRDGRQIRVWPASRVVRKDIEIFLFGFAWATLCHQRGILPLHASAIVTGGGITAFAGHSGAGKSSAAALLTSLGYDLVADDILPVSFDQNLMPGAWPYLRRLKLRRDTIVQLAYKPVEIVSEKLDKEKYFVRPRQTSEDKWRRLERLYLLESDETDKARPIEQITGTDAVHALIDHTYHFKFILGTQTFGDHLAFCTRLASKILVYRLRRSILSDGGKKLGSLICAHLEGDSALAVAPPTERTWA